MVDAIRTNPNKQVDNSRDQRARKPQFKKGFLGGGSDGVVDHVAREVLQHGEANRGSPKILIVVIRGVYYESIRIVRNKAEDSLLQGKSEHRVI